ncbi:protein rolling stone-like [Littorina saxatilis]|uniref:protein rolling stone-like n=1 Tax=Littorina saxatilis TaxID=31220 RepID=UPI0038B5A8FC
MAGCMNAVREEFKLKHFCFGGVKTERFCYFLWNLPGWVYLCYRAVLMVYTVTCVGYIATHRPVQVPDARWWSYLTQWSNLSLCLHLSLHCAVAVFVHCRKKIGGHRIDPTTQDDPGRKNDDNNTNCCCVHLCTRPTSNAHQARLFAGESDDRPPWYVCLVWISFNITSTLSLMVTLVYYVFYRLIPFYNPDIASFANVQKHAINTLIVMIEHCVTAVPCRLYHVIYPLLFCIVYLIYSVIVWADDRTMIVYPNFLDWRYPEKTICWMALAGLVAIPVLHALFFGIHKAKMAIYDPASATCHLCHVSFALFSVVLSTQIAKNSSAIGTYCYCHNSHMPVQSNTLKPNSPGE